MDRNRDVILFRVFTVGLSDSMLGIGMVPAKHITSPDILHEYELDVFDPTKFVDMPGPEELGSGNVTSNASGSRLPRPDGSAGAAASSKNSGIPKVEDDPPILRVAIQLVEKEMSLIEKHDLGTKNSLPLQKKIEAVQSRFLGIGELANILLEERFSEDIDVVWNQAMTILTEQRAFSIWEETRCNDDVKNYKQAEEEIIRDHGLWDGL